MTDVPKDLREHWLCQPKARPARCTIIAARGRTSAFDERGKSMRVMKNNKNNKKNHFQSVLPRQLRNKRELGDVLYFGLRVRRRNSRLECLYRWRCHGRRRGVDIGGYFVVLDVMAWNGRETTGAMRGVSELLVAKQVCERNRLSRVSRDGHEYPMFPAPMFSCATVEDLRQCYEGARMKSF